MFLHFSCLWPPKAPQPQFPVEILVFVDLSRNPENDFLNSRRIIVVMYCSFGDFFMAIASIDTTCVHFRFNLSLLLKNV